MSEMQCEVSALEDGWFYWFGAWFHIYLYETLTMERPAYIIGTARELCLLQGLFTGDTTL